MTVAELTEKKKFEPGTLGWTAADLEEDHIEELWLQGRYEIVDGVLTVMPPAYFAAGKSTYNLIYLVTTHQKQHWIVGKFSIEVDMILKDERVAVADVVWMTPQEEQHQAEAARLAGKMDPQRTRILVPPSLIIESVSPDKGHHDRVTKRRWYAEFGVPNYWLLDAFGKSLECLVLRGGQYVSEQIGKGEEELQPGLFPGLIIPLKEVWG